MPRNRVPSLKDWPGPILRLTRIDSTQDLGRMMAEAGAAEWTLIVAQSQTSGRGRIQRRWESPAGGLYFSLILRPSISPKRLGELSLLAAETAARTVSRLTELETAVKPPNDVLARNPKSNHAWKKICGILIEASGGTQQTEWVVLGLGMNVRNTVSRKLNGASSILTLTGRRLEPEEVLKNLLADMTKRYERFKNGGVSKRPAVNLRARATSSGSD